jgi:cell wall-associated NlpC family hydrolase
VFALAGTVALTSGLVVPRASADQISDLKAQASALASRIQNLGLQEAALSEQYDGAVLAVQTLEGKVAQAAQQVAAASAHASRARTALQADAINAYVHGGTNPLIAGGNPVSDATNGLLRAEYVNSLATDQSENIDEFRLAAVEEQTAKANLQRQTAAAQDAVRQVARDRQAVISSQGQLEATLKQDTGQIAVLVAQKQAAEAAAAAAAARARIAAQHPAAREAAAAQVAAAQAAAARQVSAPAPAPQLAAASPRASGGGSGSRAAAAPAAAAPAPPPAQTVSAPAPAPPVGSGAGGAVAAAESRVGDPYVYGAAGPGAFDCSGLVMWAYAQVGISLPHFSGAQYADTTHISMSQLEPGDLVFPADPGQHVAMYVGGGMIVEASHTGVPVHVVPMYSWFVLASRVA